MITELAEEEPTKGRSYRHHADKCGGLRIRYSALFGVRRLLDKITEFITHFLVGTNSNTYFFKCKSGYPLTLCQVFPTLHHYLDYKGKTVRRRHSVFLQAFLCECTDTRGLENVCEAPAGIGASKIVLQSVAALNAPSHATKLQHVSIPISAQSFSSLHATIRGKHKVQLCNCARRCIVCLDL